MSDERQRTPTARVTVVAGQPLVLELDGVNCTVRPKERVVLAALTLRHPDPVDTEMLVHALWPDGPPTTARKSLHNHLARIRKVAGGLVDTGPRGYSLSRDAEIVVVPSAAGAQREHLLTELGEAPGLRRLVDEFERRWSRGSTVDVDASLLSDVDDDVVDALARDVAAQPLDERRWWRLMVAQGVLGRRTECHDTLERAKSALLEVGLEPGRRLLDLDRLVRDGVTDPVRLTADSFGRSGSRPSDDRITSHLPRIRELFSADENVLIEVAGDDDQDRADVLLRLVHESRVHGFEARLVRFDADAVLPPDPRVAWRRNRPALVAIDGAEACSDLPRLLERLRRARRAQGVTNDAMSFVVTTTLDTTTLDTTTLVTTALDAAETDASLRLPLDSPSTEERVDVNLDMLGPGVVELAAALVLLGMAVEPSELDAVLDDATGAARAGIGAGVFRHDMRSGQIDVATSALRAAIRAHVSEPERAELAARLLLLEFTNDDPLVASVRRAELGTEAHGADAASTVAAVLDAADACAAAGDLHAAAILTRRGAGRFETVAPRDEAWCRLAVAAGRYELAAGIGERGAPILLEVIECAQRLGDEDLLSQATLELCRLGPAATAGRVDPRNAALVSSLFDTTSDSIARARIGAAAAMVLSFVGEPERLRSIFEDTERNAREAGDEIVLCDVLPLTYLSLPLPSDLPARTRNAAELIDLGRRHGLPEAVWEGLQLRLSNQVMTATGDVRATFAELERLADEIHERGRTWEMHYLRSNMALLDGDVDEARRHIDASLVFAGDVDPGRVESVWGAHHLAIAMIDRRPREFLDPIRSLTASQPDVSAWRAAHALAAASAGELDEAFEVASRLAALPIEEWTRDHTLLPALIAFGEAAVLLGDDEVVDRATTLLDPFAGAWSWCGSCTFGPIDLTRSRLALARHDHVAARRAAADALKSATTLRAPRYVDHAIAALLATP